MNQNQNDEENSANTNDTFSVVTESTRIQGSNNTTRAGDPLNDIDNENSTIVQSKSSNVNDENELSTNKSSSSSAATVVTDTGKRHRTKKRVNKQ